MHVIITGQSNRFKFIANCASGIVTQVVTVICGIVLVPLALHYLGTERFGYYQLGKSAIVFLGLMQAGMGPALVRFYSQSIATQNKEQTNEISSSALLVLSILGLLLAAASALVIPGFINAYATKAEHLKPDLMLYLVCLSGSLLLSIVSLAPQGYLLGKNQYTTVNIIGSFEQILRMLLLFLAFNLFTPSLGMMGIIILASAVVKNILLLLFAKRLTSEVALLSYGNAKLSTCITIIRFSGLTFIGTIASAVIAQGPVLITGRYLDANSVAWLAPVFLVSLSMQQLLGNLAKPLVPIASRFRHDGRSAELGAVSIMISQALSVAGLTLALPFVVFGMDWTALWLGNDMAWIWKMISIMAISTALSQTQFANYFLALGGGNITPMITSQVALAAFTCIGLLIGFHFFSLTLIQCVIFIAIAKCIRNVIYLPFAYSKELFFKIPAYMVNVYVLPVVLALVCASVTWSLCRTVDTKSILALFVQSSLLVGFYLVACCVVLLSASQRRFVLHYLRFKPLMPAKDGVI